MDGQKVGTSDNKNQIFSLFVCWCLNYQQWISSISCLWKLALFGLGMERNWQKKSQLSEERVYNKGLQCYGKGLFMKERNEFSAYTNSIRIRYSTLYAWPSKK